MVHVTSPANGGLAVRGRRLVAAEHLTGVGIDKVFPVLA